MNYKYNVIIKNCNNYSLFSIIPYCLKYIEVGDIIYNTLNFIQIILNINIIYPHIFIITICIILTIKLLCILNNFLNKILNYIMYIIKII